MDKLKDIIDLYKPNISGAKFSLRGGVLPDLEEDFIKSNLAIIITTSPIPSNPATNVIDIGISSIRKQKDLNQVKIYIVCDGVKVKDDPNIKQFKSGKINEEQKNDYDEYKKKLKSKYKDKNLYEIIEKDTRNGFAGNIHSTMNGIKEPYVMIFQHDFVFLRDLDFQLVMKAFKKYNNINYIGFRSKSVDGLPGTLLTFKRSRVFFESDTKEEILDKYKTKFEIPLCPLNFWYDRVHIARKDYYLKEVFKQHTLEIKQDIFKVYKTKNFVEDTFGQYMRDYIAQDISRINEFGAFIFWDDEKIAVTHTDGRSFRLDLE